MGRGSRLRPKHLGKKLKRIRETLELSQAAMCKELGFKSVYPSHISGYERGTENLLIWSCSSTRGWLESNRYSDRRQA